MAKEIKDWRSTGRRIARRTLYASYQSYECTDCGRTSITPPKDAPKHFEEIWPILDKLPQGLTIAFPLEADHEDKDVTNNDLSNLRWRCPSCHALHDRQTAKGVSTVPLTFPEIY